MGLYSIISNFIYGPLLTFVSVSVLLSTISTIYPIAKKVFRFYSIQRGANVPVKLAMAQAIGMWFIAEMTSVVENENYYTVNYWYKGEVYSVNFLKSGQRKVQMIAYNYADNKTRTASSDELFRFNGPYGNWHATPETPSDYGCDSITLNCEWNASKTFTGNENIFGKVAGPEKDGDSENDFFDKLLSED